MGAIAFEKFNAGQFANLELEISAGLDRPHLGTRHSV
jgi:hypothetical protein